MSDVESTSNTTVATSNIATPNIVTKVEVTLDPETEKLFKAQENIPSAWEETVRLNRQLWSTSNSNSTLSVVRTVAVLVVVAIIVVTTILAAVSSGDPSKIASAAIALNNIAQTLALTSNGTLPTTSQNSGI